MFFPTSHYRLITQTNTPTIFATRIVESNIRIPKPTSFHLALKQCASGLFSGRAALVPPELGEAIRALPKRIPQGNTPQSD
jgi:hypothetical protein